MATRHGSSLWDGGSHSGAGRAELQLRAARLQEKLTHGTDLPACNGAQFRF